MKMGLLYLVSCAVNSQSHVSVPTSHSLTFSSSPAIARMEFLRGMVNKKEIGFMFSMNLASAK